ncbi:G2/mitotic-specific cyclin-B3 [Rhynchonycteris naso]
MPLPLPLGSSKHETTKSQSSKIVTSDHAHSEKREENYQAKISPSSPQGPLKKRSALDDLTNASQSQPAQPKKEANKEFVKDVSKKIKRNLPALRLAKSSEMNIKKYELEPSAAAVSPTVVTHIMKKSITMKRCNSYKTPTTEEASLLKVKPTTRNTLPIKRSLCLKKCRNEYKVSIAEKPLTLLEETESDFEIFLEPVTLRQKHKTDKAAITKRKLFFQKTCTCKGKHSNCREELTLLDINVENDSSFIEPVNFRRKPKTEEAVPTKRLLTLNKCTTQEKMSYKEKPLIFRKVASKEKSFIKEPLFFEKKPTTEEFIFQEPSLLQEKHTIQGEVSTLKKPLALQKTPAEGESFLKEALVFKKKRTIEEATSTEEVVFIKKKCTTQGQISCFKKPLVLQTISEAKSLIKEPFSFKQKPTTEEGFLFKETSILSEKHTTPGEVALLKKPWTFQENIYSNSEFLMEPVSFRNKHTTNEANSSKEPLYLMKKYTTQMMSTCQEMYLQNVIEKNKDSFLMELVLFRKESSIEEAIDTKIQLPVKKQITQGKRFLLKNPVVLEKTTSEEEPLFKEVLPFKKNPSTDEAFLRQDLSVLKEEHITILGVSHSKNPLALQEKTTTEEESYIKEPLEEEPTTEEKFLFQEPFLLPFKSTKNDDSLFWKGLNMQNKTDTKEDSLEKQLTLQENSTTEEDSPFKKPLFLKKKLSIEATTGIESQLSLKKKLSTQGEVSLLSKPLSLQETITNDEEFLIKQPLTLQEKPSIEKESLFKELSFQGNYCCLHRYELEPSSAAVSPTVVTHTVKKPVTMKRSVISKTPTTEEASLFKKSSVLKLKPNTGNTLPIKRLLPLKKCTKEYKVSIVEKPLLTLLEETERDFEIFLEPVTRKKKHKTEKAAITKRKLFFQKTCTCKGKHSNCREELTLLDTNVENDSSFIEPVNFRRKPKTEEAVPTKRLLTLNKCTTQEKMSHKEKPLIFRKVASKEKSLFNRALPLKMFSLNEKPTTGKELSFEEPLALQDNPTNKKDTFLKDDSILQVETSPYVVSTAPESRIGIPSSGTMSSVNKFNTKRKSSACESSYNKPFSSWGKRSRKEQIIPLKNTDTNHNDIFYNSIYVKDIFRYMKEREEKFILKKYIDRQTHISSNMRAILVNWLVEVQITFQMNHETLYLAVKLVDHYLMKVICKKDKLQLLGSGAFLIAAKFQESYLPSVDDFLYICNDAYQQDEILAMEIHILQTLEYDINIPIAYHFLRRYSWCVPVSMNTATLSRFICEMTLQEYDFIEERASMLAAASFLLALYMKKLRHLAPTLEYYSGYKTSDLHPLVKKLNILLTLRSSDDKLKVVRSKYSHLLFSEVTKIPPLDLLKLEDIFNSC